MTRPSPEALAGLTDEERDVVRDLATMTYDEVRLRHGWSRGRIWKLAMRTGARKTEDRIRERAADRKARQRETLLELLDQTATADVLDYLNALPDDCARLVLTSCPYNLGKPYGAGASADAMRHVYFMGWLMQIASEASRILLPGGTLFLQLGSTRDENDTIVPLDMLLYEAVRKTGLTFQSRIAWIVPHGLTPRQRVAERYETVLVMSKGPIGVFNPTPVRIPQKQPGKRAFKGPNKGQLSGHPLGAFPPNVWEIPNVGHNNGEKTGHPAQFPLELARRAVMLYSNPGDLVVDPFSGSGTTHVACRENGRSFTGCDLFYEDVRARRLAAVSMRSVTPLPGVTDESVAVWQADARRVDYAVDQLQLV
jgi:DNA modification methylase